MGRPKGSKNKATLAKELGMSLEEYNSSLKSTEYNKLHPTGSEYNKVHSTTDKENKVESINKGAEHPNITSNTRFLLPKEDEEEGAESTSHLNKDILNKTIKALEEVKYIQDTKEAKELSKIKSPSKGHIYCDRCHKEVLKDNTKTLDFSKLLGIGEYHFKTENKVNLCYDCLLGLGKVIDEYLYNEGKGNKLKIEVEENGEER